ncbi:peptidylprolyl isomerase [Agrilutibacter solisilvae]|uniref:peptidylprolyl isomerase n=1 Tax=Agrilutibacter solisilvae TaxID=2763317 RepID=A0A974Y438_9GAMM|nr:peptidylprolyl isomerase [Lysobacter solisilvae]QSX77506.1 hypothetical protein I8J32_012170 [Lysobacter solisilvae]
MNNRSLTRISHTRTARLIVHCIIASYVGLAHSTASPTYAADVDLSSQRIGALASAGDLDAVRIDDERLGRTSLAILERHGRLQRPALSPDQVLEETIENRLLAKHAQARFSDSELFPERRVGFSPEAVVEARLLSLLHAVFGEELKTGYQMDAGSNLSKVILNYSLPNRSQLLVALGEAPTATLAVDEASHNRAAEWILIRYRLPGGKDGILTLDDIYRLQNVQGRLALHQLDVDFLADQARNRLAALVTLNWAARRLGDAPLAELRRSVADHEYAHAVANHLGVGESLHDGSAYLDRLASEASQTEIEAWYDSHRDQFRYIKRVRARHIRLDDESQADRVASDLLDDGSNFSQLARLHSQAPDREIGGQLGWLARKEDSTWLEDLAFALPLHRNGRPARAPGLEHNRPRWEIIRVDDHEVADYSRTSETVRYQAARAIAEMKAKSNFTELRKRLRLNAKVRTFVHSEGT